MKVTDVLTGGAELSGAKGGVGLAWAAVAQRVGGTRRNGESWGANSFIRTDAFHGRKRRLVGSQGARWMNGSKHGMWVDAVVEGASGKRRKVCGHGDAGTREEAAQQASPCGGE